MYSPCPNHPLSVDGELGTTLITGAPCSGKTAALVQAALSFASSHENSKPNPDATSNAKAAGVSAVDNFSLGTAPQALFVCKDNRAKNMLLAQHPELKASDDLQVVTWEELCLAIMATGGGFERFHRQPRVVQPYEMQVLREDLKICDIRKKQRADQILAYIFSNWSSLVELGGTSLEDSYTWEEQSIIEQLEACLSFTGGILPCELPRFAYLLLLEDAGLLKSLKVDALFVDDFDQLSKAKQQLALLLAQNTLYVAACSTPQLVLGEQFPHFEGVAELLEAYPHTQVSHCTSPQRHPMLEGALGKAATDTALASLIPASVPATTNATQANLLPQDASDSTAEATFCNEVNQQAQENPLAGVNISLEESMEGELRTIAQACATCLQASSTVVIVGTNAIWRKNVISNLSRAGLPVQLAASDLRLGKDLRDERSYRAAKEDAFEKLNLNPDDGVAWRTLLACGDYLGNSTALDLLQKSFAGSGLRLHEALEALASGTVEQTPVQGGPLEALVAQYRSLKEELAAYKQQKLSDGQVAHEQQKLASEQTTPQEQQPTGDTAQQESSLIEVCSPEQALCRDADYLIFGGCVTGLIPCSAYSDPTKLVGNARERERTRCIRTLYSVAARAQKGVLFTGFTHCSLPVAEMLDVHMVRSGLKNGIRTATLDPCEFLKLFTEESAY